MNRWRGIIEEYRKFLPVSEKTPVISLAEGNTPLIRAARLAKASTQARLEFLPAISAACNRKQLAETLRQRMLAAYAAAPNRSR